MHNLGCQHQLPAPQRKNKIQIVRKQFRNYCPVWRNQKVERLSGELNVTKRVNALLSQEVDDLQQYQRRSCIIIDGINHNKCESVADITSKAKNVLNKHKCHRIGPKNEDGIQATMLKFKSHSFKVTQYTTRGRKSRTEKSKSGFS